VLAEPTRLGGVPRPTRPGEPRPQQRDSHSQSSGCRAHSQADAPRDPLAEKRREPLMPTDRRAPPADPSHEHRPRNVHSSPPAPTDAHSRRAGRLPNSASRPNAMDHRMPAGYPSSASRQRGHHVCALEHS